MSQDYIHQKKHVYTKNNREQLSQAARAQKTYNIMFIESSYKKKMIII